MKAGTAGLGFVGALIVSGCSGHDPSAATASSDFSLRFDLSKPVNQTYEIHREWKAMPKNTGSGNQVHDITVRVQGAGLKAGAASDAHLPITLKVAHFSGKDLDGGETNHLRKIASEIETQTLHRPFTSLGPTGDWESGGSNNAGWAGMMADKAMGSYEIGFMDVSYPSEPVHVGSKWTKEIPFGDEVLYRGDRVADEIHDLKGNQVHCTFELRKLDPIKRTATIAYSGSTKITFSYQASYPQADGSLPKANPDLFIDERQEGEWDVNLDTGLPIRFTAKRTTKENFGSAAKESTESTVTAATLKA